VRVAQLGLWPVLLHALHVRAPAIPRWVLSQHHWQSDVSFLLASTLAGFVRGFADMPLTVLSKCSARNEYAHYSCRAVSIRSTEAKKMLRALSIIE
jgi:hypothetical protein